jgi:hypothetical protein
MRRLAAGRWLVSLTTLTSDAVASATLDAGIKHHVPLKK